ncbi:hypothetical protein [Burkholderia sp. LMU1-1-1.1]|uniref:hypothetical protein n=1 Tax=Burkholderia sp. LMU1-1-1.1 TaxID=3135266 RepID=UPI003433105F
MRAGAPMALAALLSGCCYQTIRLQSSWYILEEDVKKSATYVSVLNTGNTAVTVETLIINPLRDKVALFDDPHHDGWTLVIGERLEPGQLLIKPAGEFSRLEKNLRVYWHGCRVPIEVDAQLSGRPALVVTDMKTAMPDSLPAMWDTGCPQATK